MQRNETIQQGRGELAPTIRAEVMYLANLMVGGDGNGQVVIEEAASPEDTIVTFLRRLSAPYPKFKEAMWDRKTGGLSEHLAITVNGVPLGLRHLPDSPITGVHTIGFVYATCGGI